MSESPRPAGAFHVLAGFVLRRPALAIILLGAVLLGGYLTAPFDWSVRLGGVELPRAPMPVDALPDLGENQQIVFTRWPGRSPQDVEDQVTYPLTSALLGLPRVRTVRSNSMFGFSSVYVVFEDGVDVYWARARITEKLAALPADTLPPDAEPALGPDATALGQIFWYTLEPHVVDADGTSAPVAAFDQGELRTLQDYTLRYALQAVPGVAEVASIGGFVEEVQVDLDPEAMRAHGVRLADVLAAVRDSNLDVGARTLEINRVEYVLRGRGLLREPGELEETVVSNRDGATVRLREIATVGLGPAARRGALDDAGAPAVGGVVIARHDANPLAVSRAVRARIAELAPGLPRRVLADGREAQVRIVPFYDRAELVGETLDTLSRALWQQVLITLLVVLVLVGDPRRAGLVALMLPLGVLATFVVLRLVGVTANVMALGGIAIAIGTMVDVAIVLSDAIAERLQDPASAGRPKWELVRDGVGEIAPAVTTSVATTVVAFLPVFSLSGPEAKLFAPLAFSKTFAMIAALVLSLLALPVLALWLFPRGVATPSVPAGGPFRSREPAGENGRTPRDWVRVVALAILSLVLLVSLARAWAPLGADRSTLAQLAFVALLVLPVLGLFFGFARVYPRLLAGVLRQPWAFLGVLLALGVFGFGYALPRLGREYLPPFDEGAFLYMPTTMPHASFGEALALLEELDTRIAAIPEVDRVVGKIGRVESALDPAPVSMIETLITLRPEYGVDEQGERVRLWRDEIRSADDVWDAIVDAGRIPGLTSAPLLMPIGARLVMLQSGMRAPLGLEVSGPNLEAIESFGVAVERVLREVPALRAETVFADRLVGKPYLEIDIDREAIARYGLSVGEVQRALSYGLGGQTLTRTLAGRERRPVRVRYLRETRDSVEALRRLTIDTRPVDGAQGEPVPLSALAQIRYVRGPQMIRSENTFPTSYVIFDRAHGVGEAEAVDAAMRALDEAIAQGALRVPDGVQFRFAGTFAQRQRAEARLLVVVPFALLLVVAFLYLQFRRLSTVLFLASSVAVALVGAFSLLWLYGQPGFLDVELFGVHLGTLFRAGPVHLSVAVWVGVLALAGIAVDDGVVMATLLERRLAETFASRAALHAAIVQAATRRVRACLLTSATTLLALLPVVSSQGRGADLMAPLALPAVGGMTLTLVTLFIVPVLYSLREGRRVPR